MTSKTFLIHPPGHLIIGMAQSRTAPGDHESERHPWLSPYSMVEVTCFEHKTTRRRLHSSLGQPCWLLGQALEGREQPLISQPCSSPPLPHGSCSSPCCCMSCGQTTWEGFAHAGKEEDTPAVFSDVVQHYITWWNIHLLSNRPGITDMRTLCVLHPLAFVLVISLSVSDLFIFRQSSAPLLPRLGTWGKPQTCP